MADPILSPDGRYVLINGQWVELAQQQVSLSDSVIAGDVSLQSTVNINTRQPEEEIRNLAEVALVKLTSGDMVGAKDAYTEAKKVNVSIAQRIFEIEFAPRIGAGYVDIVDTICGRIALTFVTVSGQFFGTAGTLWDVNGNHELSANVNTLNIALGNALAFLGSPAEFAGMTQSELHTAHDERFDHLFKLGQLCKFAGNSVLRKTNYAHVVTDGVTRKFIDDLRLEALQLSSIGNSMIANISLADANSGKFMLPNWQTTFRDTVSAADESEAWAVELEKERSKQAKLVKAAKVDADAEAALVWIIVIIFMICVFAFGSF